MTNLTRRTALTGSLLAMGGTALWTATRPARDISRQVERVGGDRNAYTAKQNTTFYCRMPARHAVSAVELLADVVTSPLIDPVDVESERQVILEELAMDDDSPDEVVHRVFGEQLFPGHPLGRDTGGDRDTVRRLPPDDSRRFHDVHYAAESMVVAIAGAWTWLSFVAAGLVA